MKPFVAIGGVLDYMYLFAKYVGSVSVDDCAQAEKAYSAYGLVRGATIFQPRTGPYAPYDISDLAQSAFCVVQNAHPSSKLLPLAAGRWSWSSNL